MLQCVRTGRNPTMRHLARTHRISVSWMHEQYRKRTFRFMHESGERMPPDIFTKMFSDKDKWKTARHLISVVMPEELDKIIKLNSEIHAGILDKPAMAGQSLAGNEPVRQAPVHPSGGTLSVVPPSSCVDNRGNGGSWPSEVKQIKAEYGNKT